MDLADYYSRKQKQFLLIMCLRAKKRHTITSKQKKLMLLYNAYLNHCKRNAAKKTSRRWWVRPINERRNDQGDGDHLINEMRLHDPDYHFMYCGMTIDIFDELLFLVGPQLQKMRTNFRDPISPRIRLYMTLRYSSTGDKMTSIALAFRTGCSTVSAIISETCECLWNALQNQMFVPSRDNWMKVANDFHERWNFPHCIGALDGKHVVIKAPPKSGSTFYNYKGTHSINLMAIVSASYRFLLVDIGAEGRHSDGGVFKNSTMGQLFSQNKLLVPPPSPIANLEDPVPYVLVADEAFQLTNYTMRPYPGKTLSNERRIFNYRLSRARRVVENAFGIMVARWGIFGGPMNTSLQTTEKIIKACVVLHNFLMDKPRYCRPNFADRIESNGTIRLGEWREDARTRELRSVRGVGSNTHTRHAAAIRDKFTDYFLGSGAVPWQWDHVTEK